MNATRSIKCEAQHLKEASWMVLNLASIARLSTLARHSLKSV
jgi:hypothetical protein